MVDEEVLATTMLDEPIAHEHRQKNGEIVPVSLPHLPKFRHSDPSTTLRSRPMVSGVGAEEWRQEARLQASARCTPRTLCAARG